MENLIKAGYCKNALGYEGHIAENELTVMFVQQLVEYY